MNDGRTVIDPSSRNSKFKKLEDIKDFISVENVEIKNLNSITDWSLLKKFSNVRTLGLSNCLVDKKKFSGIHNYLDLHGDVYNCRYFKGVRNVKFNSQINPNSKANLRHKFFHLILYEYFWH